MPTTSKSATFAKIALFLAVCAAIIYLVSWYRRTVAARLALLPETVTAHDGASFRNRLGMDFVQIPAGRFEMGSASSAVADEQPPHEVTFATPFYLGRHEVTVLQWEKLMGGRPADSRNDNAPVEQITWQDAQEFVAKLNALNDGYTYRLPSEAEWEYAARAGTAGDYIPNIDKLAWHKGNSYKETHSVGQKEPNAFGVYDMLGNVWEFCQDHHFDDYRNAPADGSPRLDSQATPNAARVIRGQAIDLPSAKMRYAVRGAVPPLLRNPIIGLRLAASKR